MVYVALLPAMDRLHPHCHSSPGLHRCGLPFAVSLSITEGRATVDDNVVFTLAELHSQLRRLPSNGAQHPEACAPETMLQKARELMKRKDHEVAPWAKGDAPEFLHTILEVLLGDGRASSPEGSKVADGDTRGRHQRPTAAPSGGGGRYYTPAVVCLHRALANLIETKSKQVLTCQVCQHRKPAVYQQGFTIFPLLLHGANGHQIDSLTEAISNHFQPGVCECAMRGPKLQGQCSARLPHYLPAHTRPRLLPAHAQGL